jgi:hypothetical protein
MIEGGRRRREAALDLLCVIGVKGTCGEAKVIGMTRNVQDGHDDARVNVDWSMQGTRWRISTVSSGQNNPTTKERGMMEAKR